MKTYHTFSTVDLNLHLNSSLTLNHSPLKSSPWPSKSLAHKLIPTESFPPPTPPTTRAPLFSHQPLLCFPLNQRESFFIFVGKFFDGQLSALPPVLFWLDPQFSSLPAGKIEAFDKLSIGFFPFSGGSQFVSFKVSSFFRFWVWIFVLKVCVFIDQRGELEVGSGDDAA